MSPRARNTDPTTSHEAARSVSSLTDKQKAVLKVVDTCGPLTDEQLLRRYTHEVSQGRVPLQSGSGIRTRRNELVAKGQVVACGFAKTVTGRRAQLWSLPPQQKLPF